MDDRSRTATNDRKDWTGFYDKETYRDKTTDEGQYRRERVQRESQVPGGNPGYKDDLVASHAGDRPKGGRQDSISKPPDGKYERNETD